MIFIIFNQIKECGYTKISLIMNLQYISDNRGKTTAVFIPIQEREDLKSQFKGLEEVELADQSKEEILQGLQQAVEEMNLVKQGKLNAWDAKELLNEL